MERSEDAIRIEGTHAENIGFLHKSWKTQIALEIYFEKFAQEVWERNWMNLEMQTTLLRTYFQNDCHDSAGHS